MSNEEKILEMLVAMDARQSKTEELLVAMQGEIHSMQGEIKSIRTEVKEIHEKLDDLTEAHEITRAGVNDLLEWTDRVSSIKELHIPKL